MSEEEKPKPTLQIHVLHQDGSAHVETLESPFSCLALASGKSQRLRVLRDEQIAHLAGHMPQVLKWLFDTLPDAPITCAVRARHLGDQQLLDAVKATDAIIEPTSTDAVCAAIIAAGLSELSLGDRALVVERFVAEGDTANASCQ